jgi:hypothetical protein
LLARKEISMDRKNAMRIKRQATFHLSASPEAVFPLLCPVREHEWVEHWTGKLVYSDSGVAEAGCIFTTDLPDGRQRIWTVSRYSQDEKTIEFVIVTPGLHVSKLDIALFDEGEGTQALWRHNITALSAEGEKTIAAEYSEVAYQKWMPALEKALDHFVCTGAMLRS